MTKVQYETIIWFYKAIRKHGETVPSVLSVTFQIGKDIPSRMPSIAGKGLTKCLLLESVSHNLLKAEGRPLGWLGSFLEKRLKINLFWCRFECNLNDWIDRQASLVLLLINLMIINFICAKPNFILPFCTVLFSAEKSKKENLRFVSKMLQIRRIQLLEFHPFHCYLDLNTSCIIALNSYFFFKLHISIIILFL